jgi:hypothetical protein
MTARLLDPKDPQDRALLGRVYTVRIAAYVVTIIALVLGAITAPVWPMRIVLGVVAVVALLPLATNIYRYRHLPALHGDQHR